MEENPTVGVVDEMSGHHALAAAFACTLCVGLAGVSGFALHHPMVGDGLVDVFSCAFHFAVVYVVGLLYNLKSMRSEPTSCSPPMRSTQRKVFFPLVSDQISSTMAQIISSIRTSSPSSISCFSFIL